MSEIRCPMCKALWFKADGTFHLDIKCRKCGHHWDKSVIAKNGKVVMANAMQQGEEEG